MIRQLKHIFSSGYSKSVSGCDLSSVPIRPFTFGQTAPLWAAVLVNRSSDPGEPGGIM